MHPAGKKMHGVKTWVFSVAKNNHSPLLVSRARRAAQEPELSHPKYSMRTVLLVIMSRRRIDVILEVSIQKWYWMTEHNGVQ
jgi:hypothetical protein